MNLQEQCAICQDVLEGTMKDTFRNTILSKNIQILKESRDTYFDGVSTRRTKMLRSTRPVSFKKSNQNAHNNASIALLDSCSHLFHYECISKWAERENSCVLCKQKFHKMAKMTCRGNIEDIYTIQDRSQKPNVSSDEEYSELSSLGTTDSHDTEQELDTLANLNIPQSEEMPISASSDSVSISSSGSSETSTSSMEFSDADDYITLLSLRDYISQLPINR